LPRSYYSNDAINFLKDAQDTVLASLVRNHPFDLEEKQRNAWIIELEILHTALHGLGHARIIFEYSIPRMGKRVDVVIIIKDLVLVLEFKINQEQFVSADIDQVHDYTLDLKYFHEASRSAKLVPILVATDAQSCHNTFQMHQDGVFWPVRCNKDNLASTIHMIVTTFGGGRLDPVAWENSIYRPTPTIIEAAQALYRGHNISEISRSDAGAENLVITAETVNRIIEKSKSQKSKSICFITGVPGAGKTLAGLNLANERHKFSEQEHAILLSGNGPLVQVLQEALARSKLEATGSHRLKKSEALRQAKAFIQNIHFFRDDALQNSQPPIEKVVIFDEAQRAWDQAQTAKFMESKKGVSHFTQSEPEFLIGYMDRHKDWCVVVCLIGGGQEINTGEAGTVEWFSTIKRKYPHWNVYVSREMLDDEMYARGNDLNSLLCELKHEAIFGLHLRTSLRSFRSEHAEKLVNAILDCRKQDAKSLLLNLQEKYPIVMTRDILKAKKWLKSHARGNERIGIVASSGAKRLKPYGIFVESEIDPRNWFLNSKEDIRSSYYLEDIATEFSIQGLELDWICVAWDADYRFVDDHFEYHDFRGATWQNMTSRERQRYLKNTYRVLLTRARQGMVIFVPPGDAGDWTRRPEFYDELYQYLKAIGLCEI
jgi:hypothetical protein